MSNPPIPRTPSAYDYPLLAAASPALEFADFDEKTRAATFYSTGTTGMPKGVYFSHRRLVLHTLGVPAVLGSALGHGRFHRQDIYMPITPMFNVHAWEVAGEWVSSLETIDKTSVVKVSKVTLREKYGKA